jgi:hypothetical protein
VHNENNAKVETPDLDVLMGKAKLLRDAIVVLRDLGVPAAMELDEADLKALPEPKNGQG